MYINVWLQKASDENDWKSKLMAICPHGECIELKECYGSLSIKVGDRAAIYLDMPAAIEASFVD